MVMHILPLPLRTSGRLLWRYIEYQVGIKFPLFASWFITGKCNLECRDCVFYARMFRGEADLGTEDCLNVVKELDSIRLPYLHFVGGEPLLRSDIFKIAINARKRGIFTSLVTNGTLISRDNAKDIVESFHSVFFSLDGFRKGHDRIMGDGSFQRALDGFKILKNNSRAPRLYVAVVLNQHNIKKIGEFIEYTHGMGFEKMKIQPNFLPKFRPKARQMEEAIPMILGYKRKNPHYIVGGEDYYKNMIHHIRTGLPNICDISSLFHIAIMPDGTLSACCGYSLPLGNVLSEPLTELLKKNLGRDQDQVKNCTGCYRSDYKLKSELFTRPLWRFRTAQIKKILEYI